MVRRCALYDFYLWGFIGMALYDRYWSKPMQVYYANWDVLKYR